MLSLQTDSEFLMKNVLLTDNLRVFHSTWIMTDSFRGPNKASNPDRHFLKFFIKPAFLRDTFRVPFITYATG